MGWEALCQQCYCSSSCEESGERSQVYSPQKLRNDEIVFVDFDFGSVHVKYALFEPIFHRGEGVRVKVSF